VSRDCAGVLSRCPGYVDITLSDWTTSEELFHYDLAVLCPPRFAATFYLPHRALALGQWSVVSVVSLVSGSVGQWSLPHRALAGTTNRTFLVILDDTRQRYQVFLTAVELPTSSADEQGQSSEVSSTKLRHMTLVQSRTQTLLANSVINSERHQKLSRTVARRGRDVVLSESVEGQLSEVDDDEDDDTLKGVLVAASVVSFCCLIVLLTFSVVLTRRLKPSSRRQFLEEHERKSGGTRWKVAVGVFALCRLIYSLTFTFSGVTATCNFVVRETALNLADAQHFISTPLTSRLLRRLDELERLGGLTPVERDDTLNSSVTACGHYVDDLLSFTAVQIAPSSQLSRRSRALDRLRQIHASFLSSVKEYIELQKVELDRVVAGPAVERAKLRLSDLLHNDWLRYSTFLFQQKYTSAFETTTNLSDAAVRSVKFAVFLEAGSELTAVKRWTAAVGRRYLSLFC